MFVLGVTGQTCSGKSYICQKLVECFKSRDNKRVAWIDCDKVVHDLYAPGTALAELVKLTFGPEVLDAAGAIDRSKLGAIVFDDREALDRLSSLIWPELKTFIVSFLNELENQQQADIVLIDAAVLIRAGFQNLCNLILVVQVEEDVLLERARLRGIPEAKFRKICAASSDNVPPDLTKLDPTSDVGGISQTATEQSQQQLVRVIRTHEEAYELVRAQLILNAPNPG